MMAHWYEPEFEHYESERERLDEHRAAIGITVPEAARAYTQGYKAEPSPPIGSLAYSYWLRGRHDRLMGRPISTNMAGGRYGK